MCTLLEHERTPVLLSFAKMDGTMKTTNLNINITVENPNNKQSRHVLSFIDMP